MAVQGRYQPPVVHFIFFFYVFTLRFFLLSPIPIKPISLASLYFFAAPLVGLYWFEGEKDKGRRIRKQTIIASKGKKPMRLLALLSNSLFLSFYS